MTEKPKDYKINREQSDSWMHKYLIPSLEKRKWIVTEVTDVRVDKSGIDLFVQKEDKSTLPISVQVKVDDYIGYKSDNFYLQDSKIKNCKADVLLYCTGNPNIKFTDRGFYSISVNRLKNHWEEIVEASSADTQRQVCGTQTVGRIISREKLQEIIGFSQAAFYRITFKK